MFQTAFIFAIGFAGMIAFGYSSVSGGASLARTKYHLLAFPRGRVGFGIFKSVLG